MRIMLLAAAMAALPLPALAEMTVQTFQTECGTIDEVGDMIVAAGQRPLLMSTSGRANARMTVWVNQGTGTYTVTVVDRTTLEACVIDAGAEFEPFVEPDLPAQPEVEQ